MRRLFFVQKMMDANPERMFFNLLLIARYKPLSYLKKMCATVIEVKKIKDSGWLLGNRKRKTETFKQPEEKKENSISKVAASEHERL